MGGAVMGDLAFGHGFEQRALGLGRGAVDLVGQHHLREDRSAMEAELAGVAHEHRNADQVGGQQVARELHALVLQAERAGQRMRKRSLAHAGQVFEQQVAAGQHARQRQANLARLAKHDAAELALGFGERSDDPRASSHVGLGWETGNPRIVAACALRDTVCFRTKTTLRAVRGFALTGEVRRLLASSSHWPCPGLNFLLPQ